MKRYLWTIVVVALVCATGTAMAQEAMEEIEIAKQHMQLRHEQLALENAEREMQFEQAMREIALTERRQELERRQDGQGRGRKGSCVKDRDPGALILLCGIVHVLLAGWVFQDIRARQTGSGLWIVITLLSGFFGALIYAVVRLADTQKSA